MEWICSGSTVYRGRSWCAYSEAQGQPSCEWRSIYTGLSECPFSLTFRTSSRGWLASKDPACSSRDRVIAPQQRSNVAAECIKGAVTLYLATACKSFVSAIYLSAAVRIVKLQESVKLVVPQPNAPVSVAMHQLSHLALIVFRLTPLAASSGL